MFDGEITEGHRGRERGAGLVTYAALIADGHDAGCIEARDRPLPQVHDLRVPVGQQPSRTADARQQLHAVERRALDGAKRRILDVLVLGGREPPLQFAAMKVPVDTAARKSVEAINCFLKRNCVDAELLGKLD
jgi:hypothetical protein